jgi:predicted dehydrogenase
MTKPLRLGVIGCGRVFERYHLPAIQRASNVVLTAACESDLPRLDWLGRRIPGLGLFDSPEALFTGQVDAVLVSTPPITHAAITVGALERGLHVLVEKPMALSVEDGRRMVDAARQTKRHLQVGFNRRFRKPYRQIHQFLSGLGIPVTGGRFELCFPTASWQARTKFLGNDQLGGGAFDDVLSHQADLIGWLVGTPDEVRATREQADTLLAELRVGERSITCLATHGNYREYLELFLADGRALQATGSAIHQSNRGASRWWPKAALVNDRVSLVMNRLRRRQNVTEVSFDRQLADFVARVAGSAGEGATGQTGLQAVRVVAACRVSAEAAGSWCAVGT